MSTVKVVILNPKVLKLLKLLEELKLISIVKEKPSANRKKKAISMAEITKEVEIVIKKRYKKELRNKKNK